MHFHRLYFVTVLAYLKEQVSGDVPLQQFRQATRLSALIECFEPAEHWRLFLLLRPVLQQLAT